MKKGLFIQTAFDTNEYAKGIKISDKEMELLNLERKAFLANGIIQFDHAIMFRLFCNESLDDVLKLALRLGENGEVCSGNKKAPCTRVPETGQRRTALGQCYKLCGKPGFIGYCL